MLSSMLLRRRVGSAQTRHGMSPDPKPRPFKTVNSHRGGGCPGHRPRSCESSEAPFSLTVLFGCRRPQSTNGHRSSGCPGHSQRTCHRFWGRRFQNCYTYGGCPGCRVTSVAVTLRVVGRRKATHTTGRGKILLPALTRTPPLTPTGRRKGSEINQDQGCGNPPKPQPNLHGGQEGPDAGGGVGLTSLNILSESDHCALHSKVLGLGFRGIVAKPGPARSTS